MRYASRLVAGRWPVDRGMPLRQIQVGQQDPTGDGDAATVFEAAKFMASSRDK